MGFSFSSMLCFSVVKMQIFKVTLFSNVIKRSLVYTRQRCYSSVHTGQTSALTSCEELHEKLQDKEWHKKLRILDARWDLDDGDYRAMHLGNRISASKFFSFDECRDLDTPFDRMLPTSADFSAYVSNLGISNQHHVVVYDDNEKVGAYSSPRVWWMFRAFGHDNISILDGGFGKWCLDGYPTVSGEYTKDEILPTPKQPFISLKQPKHVMHFEAVKANALAEHPTQALDARGKARFVDARIPQSHSTPYTELFNENKTLKSKEELIEYFKQKGIDLKEDIFTTCGSGVTASILAHALFYSLGKNVPVYDGSFSEWKVRAPEHILTD